MKNNLFKCDPKHQYAGDGWYNLISNGKKVNRIEMNHEDAQERNRDRMRHGIESRWWWAGKKKKQKKKSSVFTVKDFNNMNNTIDSLINRLSIIKSNLYREFHKYE